MVPQNTGVSVGAAEVEGGRDPGQRALAGATISPGIFETVAVMGRDETLARIDAVLDGSRV